MINSATPGPWGWDAARSVDSKAEEEPCAFAVQALKLNTVAGQAFDKWWGVKQNTHMHTHMYLGNNAERADVILQKTCSCHLSKAKSQLCGFASKNVHLCVYVQVLVCLGCACAYVQFVLLLHRAQQCWGICCSWGRCKKSFILIVPRIVTHWNYSNISHVLTYFVEIFLVKSACAPFLPY